MILFGRIGITRMEWFGESSLRAEFVSSNAGMFHQAYLGRRLVGETPSADARAITIPAIASDVPEWLQIIAVDAVDLGVDHGTKLPPRPYNRVRLAWTTSGWTDARLIEITAGRIPGGAVDDTNVLGRVMFDIDRAYDFDTEPLAGPGRRAWNFAVAGRDDKPPDGNRGTAATISAEILSPPEDLALSGPDAARFSVDVVGQSLVAEFEHAL
jgi:hypothetical protein